MDSRTRHQTNSSKGRKGKQLLKLGEFIKSPNFSRIHFAPSMHLFIEIKIKTCILLAGIKSVIDQIVAHVKGEI